MLQEKVSAVTDGCMSRVQAAVQPDLLSEEPRPDLPTAPTIPSAGEPNQVHASFLSDTEQGVSSSRNSVI